MKSEYKAIKVNHSKENYHRYVAERVIGRKLNHREVVHHVDGNKLNNEPDNLEVMSLELHARLHGRQIRNPAKLRPIDIPLIRMLFRNGYSNKVIASQFNVARRTIADVRTGHTWSWLYDFKEQSGHGDLNPGPHDPQIGVEVKRTSHA